MTVSTADHMLRPIAGAFAGVFQPDDALLLVPVRDDDVLVAVAVDVAHLGIRTPSASIGGHYMLGQAGILVTHYRAVCACNHEILEAIAVEVTDRFRVHIARPVVVNGDVAKLGRLSGLEQAVEQQRKNEAKKPSPVFANGCIVY